MTTFDTTSPRFAIRPTMLSLGSANRLAALLMLSIGMLGGAAVSADQVTGEFRSQQVKLADLDLSTVDGQQLARARMHDVARTLCSRVADDLDLSHRENFNKCVAAAVANSGERLQALLDQQQPSKLALVALK